MPSPIEQFTGKTFSYDVVIRLEESRQTIEGRSWEMMLSLGFISLLTGKQILTGTTGTGRLGRGIGGIGGCSLGRTFDLSGTITDDQFTGYLKTNWTANPQGLQLQNPDHTSATVVVGTISSSEITTPLVAQLTLTADDGIIVTSDSVNLTCNPQHQPRQRRAFLPSLFSKHKNALLTHRLTK